MAGSRKGAGGTTTGLTVGKRKSGGTMVNITAGYRRVSGAWVQIWPTATAALTLQYVSQSGVTAIASRAGIRVNTSGALEDRKGSTYSTLMTWMLTGPSSNHEVMISGVTGEVPTGTSAGTYVSCDTSPEWYISDGVSDGMPVDSVFTLTIRNKTTLVTVSATITLDAERI